MTRSNPNGPDVDIRVWYQQRGIQAPSTKPSGKAVLLNRGAAKPRAKATKPPETKTPTAEPTDFSFTDHAVLRFIERHDGIDTSAARSAVASHAGGSRKDRGDNAILRILAKSLDLDIDAKRQQMYELLNGAERLSNQRVVLPDGSYFAIGHALGVLTYVDPRIPKEPEHDRPRSSDCGQNHKGPSMISIVNTKRANARILHDMNDLVQATPGSLWREASLSPKTLGRDGGNPGYVVATGSGNVATCYFVVCADDGSGYCQADDLGIFLPSEHQLEFPLTEVTDGSQIVFGNQPTVLD